jgi:hypothetical protein
MKKIHKDLSRKKGCTFPRLLENNEQKSFYHSIFLHRPRLNIVLSDLGVQQLRMWCRRGGWCSTHS